MITFLHGIKSDIRWIAWNLWDATASLFVSLAPPIVNRTTTDMPVSGSEASISDIKKTIAGSVTTWEGTYQGKPIRVRIYGEPAQESK